MTDIPLDERVDRSDLTVPPTGIEAEYRRLANALPQIIWTCTANGKLEWVNDRWVELTGMSRRESLSNKGALDVVHPGDREELGRRWTTALESGQPCEFEYRIRNSEGAYRWHLSRVVPVRDDRASITRWVAAAFDVHDRRLAEDALRTAEASLRAADRRKDEFLALLSHELRNPLSPIITAAQIMRLRGDVPAPDEVEVILRQARHLVRLVDDLLDVSRVARGTVELSKRTVELADIVAKAVETTGPLLEQRGHRLSLSIPVQGLLIDADDVRLTQVFTNLLTNAALYTPVGGEVSIAADRSDGDIVVRIRDTGVGIDAERLPTVFDVFEMGARSMTYGQGGLGLGLPLARTFTALHGGTVTAASEGAGKGSEFTVTLPISATLPTSSLTSTETRPWRRTTVRSRRILVVDDNVDGARMIAALLADAGHDVCIANDPLEALSSADAFSPEVAFVDLGLPMMDGYTLGRELRTRLDAAPPVLIALTGYGQTQDRLRSRAAGFALHLVKPVDGEQLFELLDSLKDDAMDQASRLPSA